MEQQHECFRLPVLLEDDSIEYSDPVVKSTGEEWKKIFPHSSFRFDHAFVWAMLRRIARNILSRADIQIESRFWRTEYTRASRWERCCVVAIWWPMWPRVFWIVKPKPVVDPINGFNVLKCWILFSKVLLWMRSSEAYQNIDSVERVIWQLNSSTTRKSTKSVILCGNTEMTSHCWIVIALSGGPDYFALFLYKH